MNEKQTQVQYTPADKAEVFKLYTQERVTIKEIAKTTDVTESAIKSWIKAGKWRDKKTEIQKTLIENATSEFMEHIGKERIQTARDHLEVARLIQGAIKHKLTPRADGSKPFLNERQLAVLAKALKDCADVSARAAGLSDKAPDFIGGGQGQVGQVVVVGLQPTPIQMNNGQYSNDGHNIINVTEQVTEVIPRKCPF